MAFPNICGVVVQFSFVVTEAMFFLILINKKI
jgi:hypothetical protein